MDRYSKEGDAMRQAEIDAMPEVVRVQFMDGDMVEIPVRSAAQADDDAWRAFRDSAGGQSLIGSFSSVQDEPGEA